MLLSGCIYSNTDKNNVIQQGSKITVKPKVVVESAYEGFYVNEKLEKELNSIEFASSKHLKGNPECLSLIRINISGSTTYDKIMLTLKKRARDFGSNAVGIYDYQEVRRVLVNQEIVENKDSSYFNKPKNYVLVKENKNIAKVTADLFKCKSNLG